MTRQVRLAQATTRLRAVFAIDADEAETYSQTLLSDTLLFTRTITIDWQQDAGQWTCDVWVRGLRPLKNGQPGRREDLLLYVGQRMADMPRWVADLVRATAPDGATIPDGVQ